MKPSILLIEDDDDDAYLFLEILNDLDYEGQFHHARNGLDAIKQLNLMKPEKPDIVFTDLNMPIMSGWEFLKQIKTYLNLKDIPVFVLSTASDLETRRRAIEMGASDFYTKPPSLKAMKNIVEKVIERLQEH